MQIVITFIKKVLTFLATFVVASIVISLALDAFGVDNAGISAMASVFGGIVAAVYITGYIFDGKKSGNRSRKVRVRAKDREFVECAKKHIVSAEGGDDSAVEKIEECVRDKSDKEKRRIIKAALVEYIDKALEDGLLDENEESAIASVSERYSINLGDITDLHKAKVLYDVMNGKIPDVEIKGRLPILLKDDERVIWVFQNVRLAKIVSKTKYVGGSDGVSIRIAKGVYYRKSAFKGHRITEKSKEVVDNGTLIITNKNIFFIGSEQKLKLPINKLVSIEPYEDGIELQKSGNANPVTFIGIDGWFAHNLISNLFRLQ